MAAATIRIPSLLAELVDGRREITVDAETVAGALAELFAVLPQLRVHVFDETGGVRPHVSVFYNGRAARDPERLAERLADGSTITILQAVSGGAVDAGSTRVRPRASSNRGRTRPGRGCSSRR